MILYLDTSALAKLYVAEEGSQLIQQSLEKALVVATCEIAYVEMRSALARRRREHLLSPTAWRRTVGAFDRDWANFFLVNVGRQLLRHAAATAERYNLRAYDALHLAASLALKAQTKEQIVFACWDNALAGAARAARLEILR